MPLYAVGFWASAGAKLGPYSYNRFGISYNRWEIDLSFEAKGDAFLYGGDVSGGVSLNPVPLMFGLGANYVMGSGKTIFKDISESEQWKLSMINVYVPVIYRFDMTSVSLFAGLSPIYTFATFKDPKSNTTEPFKPSGLGLGVFGGTFLRFGGFGVGGKLFLDYVPLLSGTIEGSTNWYHIINNLNYGIYLGVFYVMGLFE